MIRRLVVAAGCAAAATLVLAGRLGAQTGVLTGTIYDQTNKAGLVGVEVRIKGTDLVATTRTDGRFTIANVPAGSHQLEATREGYRPFRLPLVKVGSADTARVLLALSATDEGRARADLEFTLADASDRLQILSDKLTLIDDGSDHVRDKVIVDGVQTTSVGEVSKNAPLYVIDGILLSPGMIPRDLDGLNIKSIEVIKGETAQSLYGSRALNGVIKITTKPNPD